jgi:AbrB family looped-hinge helix DNA binding protein
MRISKLSSKFQITLPKKVREDIGAKEGDRILFVKEKGKWVLLRVPSDPVEALRYLGRSAKLRGTATKVHEEMEAWER